MKRTIYLKVRLPFKQGLVWSALTDSKLLASWFMENDFQPVLNHPFTFKMAPQKGWDGITHCQVITFEPFKTLSYTYKGEATGEKTLSCAGIHSDLADRAVKGIFTQLDTVLTFKLTPICGGTTLEMEHSGFKGFKLFLISFVMQMGWKKQLRKKLPQLLKSIC